MSNIKEKRKLIRPNYKNSILTIPSSILEDFGIKSNCPKNKQLTKEFGRDYNNIVLLVLDGFGAMNIAEHLPKASILRKKMKAKLLSTFPSATACAVTTLHTGLPPAEHGWLGMSMYVEPLDEVINVYNNRTAYTNKPLKDDNYYRSYMPFTTIYQRIDATTHAKFKIHTVFPSYVHEISENNYFFSDCDEMYTVIAKKCRQAGHKIIVAYEDSVGATMRKYGTLAPETKELFLEHERQINMLAEKCPNSLIIVTADHGLLNNDGKVFNINDYPDLCNLMSRPPSMEARAKSFGVKQGYEKQFKQLFNQHFGENFTLYSAKQVLSKKLFGENANPYINLLIGDFLAISKNEAILQYHTSTGAKMPVDKAHHSGLSKQEMLVPLILISTKISKKKSNKSKKSKARAKPSTNNQNKSGVANKSKG